jgi:hypothetical protein
MHEPDGVSAVADRLRRARSRRFVGREAELELVRGALEEAEPPFAVCFIHGPGGVGKSALLRAAEDVARAAGARVARLDLRAIEPSPPAFCAALAELLGVRSDDVREGGLGAGRCVLLLDTYEVAGALDAWLREDLLPRLPASTLVLIAGRDAPAAGWMGDPAWRELLRVLALRNLAPSETRALLRAEGVPEAQHAALLASTHGHPLAVALLVDVLRQRGDADAPADLAPDVVRVLMERFVATVPSPVHRRALEVCAHARTVTEGMLRSALGIEDAGDVFAWLGGLSFMELGPRGVFPHDLARDVLTAEARWRDPEGYAALHERVHDHIVARLDDAGADREQGVTDLVFLHRDNPFTSRFWAWDVFGEAYADTLRPGDREALLAMAERHEGEASAALVAHWLERQPAAFVVFRGSAGRALGFVCLLALHEASPADIAADPGASAMWAFAQRHAPPRPGEEVHAGRFFMDERAYQAPASPSLNVLTVTSTQRWLGRRRPAWELIGAWAEPDLMAPLMAYIEFDRVPAADYEVGGRRYGVFAHDWRRMDARSWLALMAGREAATGFDAAARVPATLPVAALSQEEFTQAVRQALRELDRPDALARNPLAAARVVADRSGGAAPEEALEALLREAVAALGHHPRDAKLQRVLDRTYLRPAATQEDAAALLDLPSSTYRRHLSRGVERVAAWLWERDVYGPR